MFCSLPKEYDQRLLSIKSKIVHAYNGHNTACGIYDVKLIKDFYRRHYSQPTMKIVKAEITCKSCLRVLHKDDFNENSRGLKYAIRHKDGFFLTSYRELTGDINKANLFLTETSALKTITQKKFKNIHTGEIVASISAEYYKNRKENGPFRDFKSEFKLIDVIDDNFEIIKVALTIMPNRVVGSDNK